MRSVGKGHIVWGKKLQAEPQAARPQLSKARWIWYPEGNPAVAAPVGKRYFRRALLLDGEVKSAWLAMTADNAFECWVNGRAVASGDNFGRIYLANIASSLRPGTNVIAVQAVNGADQPNPAALIAALSVELLNGRRLQLDSDENWVSAKTVAENWTSDPQTDGSWTKAVDLGALGMAPWGDIEQSLGSPDIYPDITRICDWLESTGVPPDFSYQTRTSARCLRYIHRTLDDAELYFVANKDSEEVQALCSFRVSGKRPELWWPDSGRRELIAAFETRSGVTRIPIRLGPVDSVFVVFRPSNGPATDPVTTVRRGDTLLVSTASLGTAARSICGGAPGTAWRRSSANRAFTRSPAPGVKLRKSKCIRFQRLFLSLDRGTCRYPIHGRHSV